MLKWASLVDELSKHDEAEGAEGHGKSPAPIPVKSRI
jgi:hypothetical protein